MRLIHIPFNFIKFLKWLKTIIYYCITFIFHSKQSQVKHNTTKNKKTYPTIYAKNRKKPEWVVDKVIYLKAIMPDNGCGSIADIFNRIHHDQNKSVSKTYVY